MDTRKNKSFYNTTEAKRKANNKFSKRNYETVGYKCKKGIKSMVQIMAENNNYKSISDFVAMAIMEFSFKIEGDSALLRNVEPDLEYLKTILFYDEKDYCFFPKNRIDYLKSLYQQYLSLHKNIEQFVPRAFDLSFLVEIPPELKSYEALHNDYYLIENEKPLYELVYYAHSTLSYWY